VLKTHRYRTGALVLAGPLCSGKTTLAEALAKARGAKIVSARAELRRLGAGEDRLDLQSFGAAVEQRTAGAWLASAVRTGDDQSVPVIVDSARTVKQIEALRALRTDAVVLYLTASLDERKRRYEARDDPVDKSRPFDSVVSGELGQIEALVAHADFQVETDDKVPDDVTSDVLRIVDLRQL
jgi:cytidylate kinase